LKLKIPHALLIIDILVVLLIMAVILLPDNWLRIVLRLPFLLFFPGFVLVEALFMRGKDASPAYGKEELLFIVAAALLILLTHLLRCKFKTLSEIQDG
jgi:uncharacterized membrane protein